MPFTLIDMNKQHEYNNFMTALNKTFVIHRRPNQKEMSSNHNIQVHVLNQYFAELRTRFAQSYPREQSLLIEFKPEL